MERLRSDNPYCQRVVLTFLDFLHNNVELAPGVDPESLEVAVECLSDAFCLDLSTLQASSGAAEEPGSPPGGSEGPASQPPHPEPRDPATPETSGSGRAEPTEGGKSGPPRDQSATLSPEAAPQTPRGSGGGGGGGGGGGRRAESDSPSSLRAAEPSSTTPSEEPDGESSSRPPAAADASPSPFPPPPGPGASEPRAAAGAGEEDGGPWTGALYRAKLEEFVAGLRRAGYFDGTEEGDPGYLARWHEAVATFNQRLQATWATNEGGGAKPPVAEADTPGATGKSAEELKAEGNAAIKARRYEEALELYTRAISICESNAVYFANRAAAHHHLGHYEAAVGDCEVAIKLDPTYSKAYSRLGGAYSSLGLYTQALEEGFRKALAVDPGNPTHRQNIEALERKLEESRRKRRDASSPRSKAPQCDDPPQPRPDPSAADTCQPRRTSPDGRPAAAPQGADASQGEDGPQGADPAGAEGASNAGVPPGTAVSAAAPAGVLKWAVDNSMISPATVDNVTGAFSHLAPAVSHLSTNGRFPTSMADAVAQALSAVMATSQQQGKTGSRGAEP